MPYINFNKNAVPPLSKTYDFTIIGAGVAGILLGIKLSERNKTVLIIESGHFEEDDKRQILNAVEQTGKRVENAENGRKRAVGGTSIAWGGQSLPFSPLDFEEKNWIENSGWPISFDDLKPFYPSANRFLNIDEWDYEGDIFERLNYKKIDFKDDHFYQHFSKWAPEPNLKKRYNRQLKNQVTILYNAVLTTINCDKNGKATTVHISNFNNEIFELPVHKLLLATGGIETNRILLANKIGEKSGWLGRCFMDHPCIVIGTLAHPDAYQLQSMFNTHVHKNRKYALRLSLTALAQAKYQLVNGSVLIEFWDYFTEGDNPYVKLFNPKNPRHLVDLKKIFKNYKSYWLSAKAFFVHRFIYKHKALSKISLMMEQEPTKASFVELSAENDQFGVPKARIHWAISPKTTESVRAIARFLTAEFERLSLGNINLYPYVLENKTDLNPYLTDVNHHLGGARMSNSPENGVVDRNLKVWGHDNIYVCSTAVFPTASHSNPTLTLMALCLRLVEHLA
jgi:choline dehydrogenase-like flavoprotein